MDIKSKISGVQHIGIPTDNIRESIEFYEKLGFENIYQTVNEAKNETVAFLQLGNLVMEIYENKCAVMKTGAIDHVALDVKEIDSIFEQIKAAGFNMLDNKVQSLPFWKNGVRFFTILGPNEEKIEFCEKL